jgi:hypothetical protein
MKGDINMKHHDIFGRLEYRRGPFYVTKKRDIRAKYTVLKKGAWTTSDAILIPSWDSPVFDSFIQAARFLAAHEKDLF